MHSKGTHTLIAGGAILVGVALGVAVVYWDGTRDQQLAVQAQVDGVNPDCACNSSTCNQNLPQGQKDETGREGLIGRSCVDKTVGRVTGKCQKDMKCKGEKGDGKPLEGKPKEMPKEMGGMPPMLPMPMPKMPMPMMPEQPKDCDQNQTRYSTTATTTASTTPQGNSPCPNTPSGVSGMFSNLFGSGSDSSTAGTIKSTFQSVSDKLTSFLWGDTESSAVVNTNAGATTNNPTEATVFPVTVSGSNAGQVSSQGSNTSGSGSGTSGGVNRQTVTGFGGSADVNTSTGPILSAIQSVIRNIQSLLSRMF